VEEENEEEKEEQICWCCQTVITGTVEEIEIHGDTETVCQDCFRSKFERCDWCDDLILSSDFHDGLCPTCHDNSFICDSCGDRMHNDEYGEDGMCQTCWEDHDHVCEGLYEYHGYPDYDWRFYHTDSEKDPDIFFGVELETDKYSDREACLTELAKAFDYRDFCYPSEDSSLSNGIEFVCQPATLKFHQTEFPWKKLTNVVSSVGGKSHQTSTCGLHIHFSKAFFGDNKDLNDLCQLKTIFLVNRFWEEFAVLARRKTNYAQNYTSECFNKLPTEKVQDLRNGRESYGGHYNGVNISPKNTVEIRLFKGTLKYETIIASIELVDYMVHFVRATPVKKLKGLSWRDFIFGAEKGQYLFLPDYLKSHNLHSDSDGKINKLTRSDY